MLKLSKKFVTVHSVHHCHRVAGFVCITKKGQPYITNNCVIVRYNRRYFPQTLEKIARNCVSLSRIRSESPESHIHRIQDIRFLQVVIKLARLKNQSTVQLGNRQPRNVGDDPGCWIEGFWRGRMTTLGEPTLLFLSL